LWILWLINRTDLTKARNFSCTFEVKNIGSERAANS
jgi:hypothetical protein